MLGIRELILNPATARANAWRAMQILQQKQYYNEIITKGETLTFPINIPTNAKNLKITLAWSDIPTAPNAEKALVNDLDIILYHAASQQNWLPWVLNHFPHPDSLSQLPTRKADHLNNVEQITLENPIPGNYDIQVNGFNITTNFQEFSIVYQFDTLNYFQWGFPAKDDNILAGETAILRWETTLNENNNTLEYSINNGASWELIAENADLKHGYYRWQSPEALATAQLRLTHDNHIYLSEIFTLSQPLSLKVGFNCPDSTLLYWDANSDANNYIIYTLESEYLTPIITTNDTFVILYKNIYPSPYIAVAAVLSDSYNGMKSYAIQYENQGTACYIRNFLADLIDDNALLQLLLGTSYEVNNIVFEKLESGNYIPIATVPASDQPLFQFSDINLKPGINTYRARVNLNNGAILYSESASIYYEGKSGFYVFPNPVSQREELNILSKDTDNLRFILYDALGRQVLNQPLFANIENISLQKMTAGIYYYAVLGGNSKIGQGKLIIRLSF
ncbi:MAG: T9SS type A sorting domain-containing protein [Saprospiraceae bacterium]|nr:T9SS type A sorting domain-containing protein [Saprospiraceae bacterium]